MQQRTHFWRAAAFAVILLGVAARSQAISLWHVTVDTGSIKTEVGYVDLQFNPGGADALDARATVAPFAVQGGSLGSVALIQGGAMGDLEQPPVTIDNTTQLNELLQGAIFGDRIDFYVGFSGPALAPPVPTTSGTSFGITLLDSTQTTNLLPCNEDGSAMRIDVNPDGTTTASGPCQYASAQLVPEVSGALLLGAGLLLLLAPMCWRRAVSARRR